MPQDPYARPEGADVPIDESDFDTSVAALKAIFAENPPVFAEGPPPSEYIAPIDNVLTTYSRPPVDHDPILNLNDFEFGGHPREYRIVRTRNMGWVIDERWGPFNRFQEIIERVDAEVEDEQSGSLQRGNKIILEWGDSPARA